MMYVKASGFELGKIGKEGYVAMDRTMLDRLKTKAYSQVDAERESQVKEGKNTRGRRVRARIQTAP